MEEMSLAKNDERSGVHGCTLREIANRSGVSVASVSRVLNRRANVSEEIRKNVHKAAAEVGYRSDPALRKLMIHLRKSHTKRLRSVVCSLETGGWREGAGSHFRAVVDGARRKAESLGYGWQQFRMEEFLARPEAVSRLLLNRGVEGILIPPVPLDFALKFDALPLKAEWEKFSVIVATHSFATSGFHRVVPDYFKNMLRICGSLRRLGYRRLGLVLPSALDIAALRSLSGAFSAVSLRNAMWCDSTVFLSQGRRSGILRTREQVVRRDASRRIDIKWRAACKSDCREITDSS